jgi:hypothetical protein
VDQLEKSRGGARMTQPLDQAVADPAAPVHGESGWLVDRDERVVFIKDRRRRDDDGRRGSTRPRRRGGANRGQP